MNIEELAQTVAMQDMRKSMKDAGILPRRKAAVCMECKSWGTCTCHWCDKPTEAWLCNTHAIFIMHNGLPKSACSKCFKRFTELYGNPVKHEDYYSWE